MDERDLVIKEFFDEADNTLYENELDIIGDQFSSEIDEIETQVGVDNQNQLAQSVEVPAPKVSNLPLDTVINAYAQANPQKQVPELADDLRRELPSFGYNPDAIEQVIQNLLVNITQGIGNAAQTVNNAIDSQLQPQQPATQSEMVGIRG